MCERHALAQVPRVAIVDLDVHFGDGTALTFYDDASVLHVSLHLDQSDASMFPFLVGKPEERGLGAGRGTTMNLPLNAGDGDKEAWRLFAGLALPALQSFGRCTHARMMHARTRARRVACGVMQHGSHGIRGHRPCNATPRHAMPSHATPYHAMQPHADARM